MPGSMLVVSRCFVLISDRAASLLWRTTHTHSSHGVASLSTNQRAPFLKIQILSHCGPPGPLKPSRERERDTPALAETSAGERREIRKKTPNSAEAEKNSRRKISMGGWGTGSSLSVCSHFLNLNTLFTSRISRSRIFIFPHTNLIFTELLIFLVTQLAGEEQNEFTQVRGHAAQSRSDTCPVFWFRCRLCLSDGA